MNATQRSAREGEERLYRRACRFFLFGGALFLLLAGGLVSAEFMQAHVSIDGRLGPRTRLAVNVARVCVCVLGFALAAAGLVRGRAGARGGGVDRWVARLGICAASLALTLVTAEAAARAYFFARHENLAVALRQARRRPRDAGTGLRLIDLIRRSENPRLIYELIPDVSGMMQGVRVAINSSGYRGPDYPPHKAPGTFRVVGVGDSIAFGLGVNYGESYMALLERHLGGSETPCEVVNLSAPGYNTAMEVEMLISRGFDYSPDLVILDFCGNDFSLPNYVMLRPDILTLKRSFCYDYLSRNRSFLRGLEYSPWRDDDALREPERLPPEYRSMIGEKGVLRAFDRLQRAAEGKGVPVLVTHYSVMPNGLQAVGAEQEDSVRRFLRAACAARDFRYCDSTRALIACAAERGGSFQALFWQGPGDPHPTPLAHEMIARHLGECIQAERLLPGVRSADCAP